jgi:phenylpropionate dioxygenase-like ring-hydroxylating dioxygenase large terminal subunit
LTSLRLLRKMIRKPIAGDAVFIRNCWYVAGWSSEVVGQDFLARTIIDVPVALWRRADGEIVAFEDLCCHRGAPLSKGRREGDCVRCMYHGLKFDADGRCIEIPGQDRIPPSMKVRTFPIIERSKWIWIWMGDAAKADPSLIVDTHWLEDPAWRSLEGYTHYDTAYELIADNLLDLAHLPYVHASTLGGSEDYAQNRPKVEVLERGIRVTRWALATTPPAFIQKVRPFAGKVDRWNIYDFTVPGIFVMDSGMGDVDTGVQAGNRTGAAMFHGCQALTPETATSTHYFFAHPHNFAIDDPETTRSIHQSVVSAFEEDRTMITLQSNNLARRPGFRMQPIFADEALNRFRRMVVAMLEEEANAAAVRAVAVEPRPYADPVSA